MAILWATLPNHVLDLCQTMMRKNYLEIKTETYQRLEFQIEQRISLELFEQQASPFVCRYRYLRFRCDDDNDETFENHTGLVNKRYELA